MKFKILVLSILVLLTVKMAFAQQDYEPGFLVTWQNDTIHGEGMVLRSHLELLFRPNNETSFRRFSPLEAKQFRANNGRFYVSKEILDQDGEVRPYFLEFLLDGKVELYTITKGSRFFIERDEDQLVELISNKIKYLAQGHDVFLRVDKTFVGYLKFYMHEAPDLFPRIEAITAVSRKNIHSLVSDFNLRFEEEKPFINYDRIKMLRQYKLEVVGGINKHNSYLSNHYGLVLHVSQPLISERFFIKGGIVYGGTPHSEKKAKYWSRPWNRWIIEEEPEHTFAFPLGIYYVFGRGKLRSVAGVGFLSVHWLTSNMQLGLSYRITEKLELGINSYLDGIVSLGGHPQYFNNNMAWSASAGISYRLR
jgi:hypothetical protein